MKKAAVVIGIDSTGELPVLRAAASGAQSFGAWLAAEGFEVRYFVDNNGPVTANAITDHITALIDQGPPEQLVIYFAGHGFLKDYSEFWILSGAPRNANEAIIVKETIELARECGIKNVAIISDACRSTPQSLQAERVRGSLIFPNQPMFQQIRPEIDRFFAALPGEPAAEMMLDKSVKQYEGIFTHCFLDAYKKPDAEMVKRVTTNGSVFQVVPNRNLKEYLRREVPALMQQKGYLVQQIPDAIVESGDSVYLGQVHAQVKGTRPRPRSSKDDGMVVTGLGRPQIYRDVHREELHVPKRDILGVRDVARVIIADAIGAVSELSASFRQEIATAAGKTGFNASVDLVETAQRQGRSHFETRSGFTVFGASVAEVMGLDMRAELFSEMGTDHVRLYPGEAGVFGQNHVSSVVLRFADGSGTVLVGLEDYIGTVTVERGGVVNVSYGLSENSYRWPEYAGKRPQLEKLRAIVAAAAKYGVFRVNQENARNIADQIRSMKGIDPTLGLYAVYAYAEVGMSDEVKSVMEFMKDDLHGKLFDVAMLAGELADSRPQPGVVPFCPMLSQGWTLLRVKRAKIPLAIESAADHLLPALWTTFDSVGMDLIFRAIDWGDLQRF